MNERWLPVTNAARVLEHGPDDARGVLLALHGYGQLADAVVDVLAPAVDAIGWALVCPEGMHRFHPVGARGAVGASWMSRHGRAHDIAANRRYLAAVVERIAERWPRRALAGLGFSQGASQLWRLAHQQGGLDLLLAIGGDIPPELHDRTPSSRPPVVLGRGRGDRIYTAERLAADAAVLARLAWPHRCLDWPGGHTLDAEVAAVVGRECRNLVGDG